MVKEAELSPSPLAKAHQRRLLSHRAQCGLLASVTATLSCTRMACSPGLAHFEEHVRAVPALNA